MILVHVGIWYRDSRFKAQTILQVQVILISQESLTASGNLTSLGIDDNATSTAITIDSSLNVNIGG
jgi:hypothetical protein